MDTNLKDGWRAFSPANAAYLAELFEQYSADPDSVDSSIREFFERWGAPPAAIVGDRESSEPAGPPATSTKACSAKALSTAIRMYGYRAARLDPLGNPPPGDAELQMETHGLRDEDLASLPSEVVGSPLANGARNALEAMHALREVYEGSSGYEFEHVSNAEERLWLRDAVETDRYWPPTDPIDEGGLLDRLTQVEAFERFLQGAFPAQTRFSLEGLDMLVPMLDDLLEAAAEAGTRTVLLGMAHRGRLNVLAHVLGKPYEQIIAEFMGQYECPCDTPGSSCELGWTGDVKYHLGARRAYSNGREVVMTATLVPNPSHLEFVNPVIKGRTRAESERRDRPGPAVLDERVCLGVMIHGDAAFVGEGVNAETLNLSGLPGYHTGGIVHIIENNQIGFTTTPRLGRSTLFASDLAKGFEVPIIHVNADDPEACVAAVRLAHAYVLKFHKDVMIDLIGYRRWGHNEGDEPGFTQPVLYRIITEHPTVRELWAGRLVERGKLAAERVEQMLRFAIEQLQGLRRTLSKDSGHNPERNGMQAGLDAGGTEGAMGHAGPASRICTAIDPSELERLNEQLFTLLPGFHLHPKLEPLFRRRAAFSAPKNGGTEGRVDWAHAEALAFASILSEGVPIRLTGEDTPRGTFSQRHLRVYDAETGEDYVPLQHLPSARASFDLWDSPLTEQATLAFEYGYNIQAPEALVLWEAQYGDFVNSAQVIVDAFMVSARSKWGELPSLVLLLPHGYEGQGPEHSSARLERFLQMATEDNLRVANCTTAAQYYHLLRRQAQLLKQDPRPLVLLTPKSLLRHPQAASSMEELAQGRFQPVIDDAGAREKPESIRRMVLCSGKLYVDLQAGLQASDSGNGTGRQVSIVRMEELYPFPVEEIEEIVEGYPRLEEIVWAQEEPRNMGAWAFVAPRLGELLGDRWPLTYVGRPPRASPAEGSHGWHVREQSRLVQAALDVRLNGLVASRLGRQGDSHAVS